MAKINKNPFKPFDQQSDYWLGFLAADGSVSSGDNRIALHIKDIDHLEKYKNFLNPELNMYIKTNATGNKMGNVYFSNKETKDYLASIGIKPNKAKSMIITNYKLNFDFLRGYFDGDGTCRKEVKYTSSSLKLLEQFQDYFKSWDIDCYIRKRKTECWDLCFNRFNRDSLYKCLYFDATVYLERKKNDYAQLIRNSKLKTSREFGEYLIKDNTEPRH